MAIIDFKQVKEEREPHVEGEAICLHCRHIHVAVAPVGVYDMECPECHTMKAVWRWRFAPCEGSSVFVCNCGNDLFYIVQNKGKLCAACGNYSGWE